jgi:GTPase
VLIPAQAVRQTVRIVSMDHPQGVLRTGDRATVVFEFISHPEYIKEGMKLLFREGKTKVRFALAIPMGFGVLTYLDVVQGLGVITKVL